MFIKRGDAEPIMKVITDCEGVLDEKDAKEKLKKVKVEIDKNGENYKNTKE